MRRTEVGCKESCSKMNMDSKEGSFEPSRAKNRKSEKPRRVWTLKEEEILIQAMKDLVIQGWKSDNGFRGGYLGRLEDAFKKQMPGTDLQGQPHINSKLQTWKKYYYSLSSILSQSGVGFNTDGTFTVECDETQRAEICKSDKKFKKIMSKGWPLYEHWKEIFGKDRANGEGAEDIIDAVNALEQEYANIDEDYVPVDYHVILDDLPLQDKAETSVCQSGGIDGVSKTVQKKRKSVDHGIEAVCTLLGEINRNTNKRLEQLASVIGYEHDLGKARSEIFSKLGDVPGLSLNEKFKVCDILAEKVEKLEVFMGLPESARPDYVCHLLEMK